MKIQYYLYNLLLFGLVSDAVVAQSRKDYSAEELQVLGSKESPRSRVKNITILKSNGGRVEWSKDGKVIFFDRKDRDGYYDVYQMRPDGSEEKCLTCQTKGHLPTGHNGQPAMHPNGRYLVFQAQKRTHVGKWGRDLAALPGLGRYHDLWLLDLVSSKFYQLTDLPNPHNTGILHPHFAKDGNLLTWTQMYDSSNNLWRLKTAGFIVDAQGVPRLSGTKTYEPGGAGFYENHGLSPDGNSIIFTANYEMTANPFSFFKQKIYTYHFEKDELLPLASEKYNESAHYSPVGKKIVWFTSVGNMNRGTDYWSMNYDGSGKQRITDFNNPMNASYKNKVITSADLSFSPDGKKVVAYLQTNLLTQNGMTVMIELDDDWYK